MNDHRHAHHMEELLRDYGPEGPAPGLRSQVLAEVGRELSARRQSLLTRALLSPGCLVAASVALGIALNVLAMEAERGRDLRMYGQRPTPRAIVEIAETVRSVTDAQTAALFERRLQDAWDAGRRRNLTDLEHILKRRNFSG